MPSWNELNEKAQEKAREWAGKAKAWNEKRRSRLVNELLDLLTEEEISSKIADAENADNPVRKINRLREAGVDLEKRSIFIAARVGGIVESRSLGVNFKFMGKAYAASLLAMAISTVIFAPAVILLPALMLSPFAAAGAAVLAAKLAISIPIPRRGTLADTSKDKHLGQLLEQVPELDSFDRTLGFLKDRVYGGVEETQKNCNLTEAFNALSPNREKRRAFLQTNRILHQRLIDEKFIIKKPETVKAMSPAGRALWKQKR